MRVNHRGGQIGMAKEFLNRAEVRAALKEMTYTLFPRLRW
jgi:hypothetical protein